MSKTIQQTFTIRPANQSDVPLILTMIKELAEFEKLSHEVTATEALLTDALFGPHPKSEVILGYLDDKPVAFALFFHNFSTFVGKAGIYLEDLYVRTDARNIGVGRKLLAYIAKIAKQRDCARFEWSVLDWNENAIQFYKKIGAKAMDEWTVYRLQGEALGRLAEY